MGLVCKIKQKIVFFVFFLIKEEKNERRQKQNLQNFRDREADTINQANRTPTKIQLTNS